jgi:hypothetical protein
MKNLLAIFLLKVNSLSCMAIGDTTMIEHSLHDQMVEGFKSSLAPVGRKWQK